MKTHKELSLTKRTPNIVATDPRTTEQKLKLEFLKILTQFWKSGRRQGLSHPMKDSPVDCATYIKHMPWAPLNPRVVHNPKFFNFLRKWSWFARVTGMLEDARKLSLTTQTKSTNNIARHRAACRFVHQGKLGIKEIPVITYKSNVRTDRLWHGELTSCNYTHY